MAPDRPPEHGPWRRALDALFAIDLRSLALFRVLLAACVLYDVATRMVDLRAHYTDEGILPGPALRELFGAIASALCIHAHASGSTALVTALFLVHLAVAATMLVGYRTRLSTILAWYLTASLQRRNPDLVDGGADVLRMLLFWSMFLPLGARFAVDSAMNSAPRRAADRLLSPATAALILQMPIGYLSTVARRTGGGWWSGEAVHYALELDIYVTDVGAWVREELAWLLPALTLATISWELVGPILAFVPVWTARLRLLVIAGFVALHVGLGLCLRLQLFAVLPVVGLVPMLPTLAWTWLHRRLRTPARAGLSLHYDGTCGFCRRVVLLLRTFLLLPETPIRTVQEDPEIEAVFRAHDSWVVVDHDGRRHVGFDGIVVVVRRSPLAWPLAPLLALPPARWLGERLYRAVADHRHALGWLNRIVRPRPLRVEPRPITSAVVAVLLAYSLLVNARRIDVPGVPVLRATMRRLLPAPALLPAKLLRIDQNWGMFDAPTRRDGWVVARATLADGAVIDLLTGAPLTWRKPERVSETFPTYRWLVYQQRLRVGRATQWSLWADWLRREWNRTHDPARRVERLEMYFVTDTTPRLGSFELPEEERLLKASIVAADE